MISWKNFKKSPSAMNQDYIFHSKTNPPYTTQTNPISQTFKQFCKTKYLNKLPNQRIRNPIYKWHELTIFGSKIQKNKKQKCFRKIIFRLKISWWIKLKILISWSYIRRKEWVGNSQLVGYMINKFKVWQVWVIWMFLKQLIGLNYILILDLVNLRIGERKGIQIYRKKLIIINLIGLICQIQV